MLAMILRREMIAFCMSRWMRITSSSSPSIRRRTSRWFSCGSMCTSLAPTRAASLKIMFTTRITGGSAPPRPGSPSLGASHSTSPAGVISWKRSKVSSPALPVTARSSFDRRAVSDATTATTRLPLRNSTSCSVR